MPRREYSHAVVGFLHDYDPPVPRATASPLAKRLRGKSVCICAGPGGVGKTTTSAALALGLARKGQRVAVVTIDPARRLASALGIDELDDEPRRIDPALLAAQGIELKGELWATMLDAKRTFDTLIGRIAPDERARDEVLANRIYQEISGAVAGTQEFSAIAKLYELHREGRFDTIVLDTPPARNALDFLDAPMRMSRFLEGRSVRMFLAPGNLAARLVGRGSGLVLSIFSRFTGVDLIGELTGFFGALGGMLDGFRERARMVDQLLRDPATAFLLVTSPEPEPAREAIFFAEQLRAAGMSRVGLIVNRVHSDGLDGHTVAEVKALLAVELGERLAARVAGNLADFDVLAQRDRATVERLSQELGDPAPILVPHLDGDVQDLAGLDFVARHLFA
jgi:anion-transporting  ArsA/GET3 family ATPase